MHRILSLVLVLISYFSTAQGGASAIPETYIVRNNIKEMIYYNSNDVASSKFTFTRAGLIQNHSKFTSYPPFTDSIVQVRTFEYDSSNFKIAEHYFQFTLGSLEFPLINSEYFSRMEIVDSIHNSKYSHLLGRTIYDNVLNRQVLYEVVIGDAINETFDSYGDPFEVEQFKIDNCDSVAFLSTSNIDTWSFTYKDAKLIHLRIFLEISNESILISEMWFDDNGLPIRERVLLNQEYVDFRIEVEQWNH